MTELRLKHWCIFGEALVDQFPDVAVIGGAPYNVARNLALLSEEVNFITRVGEDVNGGQILAEMRKLGLSTSLVQQDEMHTTGTVNVTLAADGSHTFHILANQAYDYIDKVALLDSLKTMSEVTQLYHGTLCLRSIASRQALMALCDENVNPQQLRFVDMNWREGHLLPKEALSAMAGADVLKLNEHELILVLTWLGQEYTDGQAPKLHEEIPQIAMLMKALRIRRLVVTYGEKGSAMFQQGVCKAKAEANLAGKLVDTVGAGDAFSAICMLGINKAWDWSTILQRASHFASAVCGLRGAVTENTEFYAHWRRQWQL